MTALDRLRIERGATHLCDLGPRAVAEFLAEVATAHALLPELVARLDDWRRLDPAILNGVLQRFCSGRQFPPRLAVAEGERP
jgi:hypothetical protein